MRIFQNRDCVEGMREYPDKFFDLAIVDPPYGSANIVGGYTSGKGGGVAKNKDYHKELWNQKAPDKDYFIELNRVCENIIVWGANHFIESMPRQNSSSWIVWDKKNGESSFADCELAYTNHNRAVRKFSFRWSGMLQENMKDKEDRIHPTQKPVSLYKWILQNYAESGYKILDTHVGSASSLIAFEEEGFDYVAFEIDKEYYDNAVKRIEQYRSQLKLF